MTNDIFIQSESVSSLKTHPRKCIQIGKNTKVINTGTIDVTPALRCEAMQMVLPSRADFTSIRNIKTSPLKKIVSVEGQVVAQGIPQTVQAKRRNTVVKNISVRGGGDKCRVALWRDKTERDINVGDYLQITNVLTCQFQDDIYVSSTRDSEIQNVDGPVDAAAEITVIGYEDFGDTLKLTSDEDGYFTYDIKLDTLKAVFNVDAEEVTLELSTRIPFKCQVLPSGENPSYFSLSL
ncbi:uncharacterized protein LOC119733722 [Patiria miniata]|uniref:Uncharacterized protein n=1 Tax=Patiria miniata TaxID=46514 RepID=A0A914AH61_PATMI|nr:uncharacterized protein LOC119733722 [Patiria miniata]